MNAPTAITTFSPEYYEKWGRDGLASLVEYWPGPIVAYCEGKPPNEFAGRVEYRDLFAQPELNHFLEWTAMVPLAQGMYSTGRYHYNFDARKFGRKVFAITDYALELKPFFFIGADVRALKPIPHEFLADMIEGRAGAFIIRQHLDTHIESDFAGYNPQHSAMRMMLQNYRTSFTSGIFLLMPAWHDCYVLDRLIVEMNVLPHVLDLSEGKRGDDALGWHVWPKTRLAEYMVHHKGRVRKKEERKKEVA